MSFWFIESYIAQFIGFIAICFAWWRAYALWRAGRPYLNTRRWAFAITTIGLIALLVPAILTICYFYPGCFKQEYRDFLRIFSGNIIALYGISKVFYFYTKDDDV